MPYFVYRPSDGLFLRKSSVPLSAGDGNLNPIEVTTELSPFATPLLEIEELFPINGVFKVFSKYKVWESGNYYPFYIEGNKTFNLNLTYLVNNNSEYTRTDNIEKSNGELYYEFQNGNNKIYVTFSGSTFSFYTLSNSTFTSITGCSWITRIQTFTTPSGGMWILRRRKEVNFENFTGINDDHAELSPKGVSLSVKAAKELIDKKLGFNAGSGTSLKTIAFIKKGNFSTSVINQIEDTNGVISSTLSILFTNKPTLISETDRGIKTTTDGNNTVYETSDSAIDGDFVTTPLTSLILACDFEIEADAGNNTTTVVKFTKGTSYVTACRQKVNNNFVIPANQYIPVMVNCTSIMQKIDNDFTAILRLMAEGSDTNENYRNPFTNYIDQRIETYISEIAEATKGDSLWNKYYNTKETPTYSGT